MTTVTSRPDGNWTRTERLLGHVQHPETYREVLLTSAGAPIALSVWEPDTPRATVVFVPGTAAHPLFYEEFLDRLVQSGLAVVGVHPQAHGKSPRVRRVLRFADLVTNAVDAARWASRELGRPVVLCGSSQGGLIAPLAATAGAPVVGVVAHNIFDPQDPSAAAVTRFRGARRLHRPVQAAMSGAARLVPRLPVPVTAYLDLGRVFGAGWTRELFELDPLGRRSYPLQFLADLMTVDTRPLYDGSLRVPVTVLATRGDPLFALVDLEAVACRLVAPQVDLVVLEADCHLVLNEALDLAVPAVVAAVDGFLADAPRAASRTGA
ncbi:MAG TPA: alpha/beta hydrolase [Jiangellales bacterium]|nr:alpha/beta hydrolase [Jiangellales bacterium]